MGKALLQVNQFKLGSWWWIGDGPEVPWFSALVHFPNEASALNTSALIKHYADFSTFHPVSRAGQQGSIGKVPR